MYSHALLKNYLLLVVILTIQLTLSHTFPSFSFGIGDDLPHNLTLGERQSNDSLLNQTVIELEPRFLRWVGCDFIFPEEKTNTTYNITMVEVTDLVPDGEGGYPLLIEGGPGCNNVTIELVSKWNRGIHFNITVFGNEVKQ